MKYFKTPCVYILKCSDNSYYIGVTNNIERRFNEHLEGINKTCYTYKRRPLELVYTENYTNFLEAISREKQLKRWSREKKEALISGKLEKLISLSKSRGSTSSP